MRRAALLLLLTACATAPQPLVQSVVDDDTRNTIEALRDQVSNDPADGARIYILAQYLDRTGDTSESLKWLEELDRIGWMLGVNDHDFLNSHSTARYRTIASRLNSGAPAIVHSTTAFTIPEPDLVPEGIAFDATTGDFYVSSIHLRKIIRVTPDGKSSDFTREAQDGMYGTLGVKVDAQRRLLWAISNAAHEMKNYVNAADGQSSVLVYDLRDRRLVTKIDYGNAQTPSLLNDLVILDDGSALITDTDGGGVVRVRLGSDSIEPWLPAHTFMFPNGIAAGENEPFVYVADFNGISRVDVRSRTVTPLYDPETGGTLSGIDGLTSYRGALIAIQNGVGRPRVIRINLNDARDEITRVDVLESGNPLFDEPTTGAIANGAFFFMANPQLRSFDAKHHIWPASRLRDVIVLKLALD